MLGSYDFCGHYDWTFEWLRREGGEAMVQRYWEEAISRDSQNHARELILAKGIEGMKEYWGHTLREEAAEYTTVAGDDFFRLDMHDCPSKGFLLRNGIEAYSDYCDHCIGWIGPMMREAGFIIHHEHNHRGQCWWEMRKADAGAAPSKPGALSGDNDVRLADNWAHDGQTPIDRFISASAATDKRNEA
jgi:hypothetical protein